MASERALTVRDVAERYGVTAARVYDWIKGGHIRPMRLPGGGPYRFRPADLEEFETRCRGENSNDQTTVCVDGEPVSISTLPILKLVTRDPFQRGRLTGRKPKSGGTNG
jgi:excisionase family DNA binding protein